MFSMVKQELSPVCSNSPSEAEYSPHSTPATSDPSSFHFADDHAICSDILNQAFTESTNMSYESGEMDNMYYDPNATQYVGTVAESSVPSTFEYTSSSTALPPQYTFAGGENFSGYHLQAANGTPQAMTSSNAPINQSHGNKSSTVSQKPKRKRVINKVQRKAANIRERRRMVTLNEAFERLKQRIPRGSKDKKLSRIDTLRTAISYITSMQKMLIMADSQESTAMTSYPAYQYQMARPSNMSNPDRTYICWDCFSSIYVFIIFGRIIYVLYTVIASHFVIVFQNVIFLWSQLEFLLNAFQTPKFIHHLCSA